MKMGIVQAPAPNDSVDKHQVEHPVCRSSDHPFDRRKAQWCKTQQGWCKIP